MPIYVHVIPPAIAYQVYDPGRATANQLVQLQEKFISHKTWDYRMTFHLNEKLDIGSRGRKAN